MEEARRFRVTGARRMVNQGNVYKDQSVARAGLGKVGIEKREREGGERGVAEGKLERWAKREGGY